jgi:hypothetical protein
MSRDLESSKEVRCNKVVNEGFLENFLCVLEDSYCLFKLKFNKNVANTSNMD